MDPLLAVTPVDKSPRSSRDRIREEWSAIAGKIIRRWPKVTVGDVLIHRGDTEYLARVLQERCEVDRRQALLQVHEFENEL